MNRNEEQKYTELVEQVQNTTGRERENAFNALIDQFTFAAHRWAYEKLGDIHATQDAVQEAFLIAYQHIDDLRDAQAFPAWMRRIVWTQCNRQVRRKSENLLLDEDNLLAPLELSSEVEQRFLHGRLRQAISDLPVHEQVVTKLYYLDGYSQKEIAEQLHIPLTAVKKRL